MQEFTDCNWGFVTYCCTYGDDKAWDKFMSILKARVKFIVEGEGVGDLYDRIDWIVFEDSGTLDGASTKDVQR